MIVGYTVYVDLVGTISLASASSPTTPMTQEAERCELFASGGHGRASSRHDLLRRRGILWHGGLIYGVEPEVPPGGH
ncbi:MAG: hypothetical protein ACLU9S_11780 [Oscillospiraceae bacterium]